MRSGPPCAMCCSSTEGVGLYLRQHSKIDARWQKMMEQIKYCRLLAKQGRSDGVSRVQRSKAELAKAGTAGMTGKKASATVTE